MKVNQVRHGMWINQCLFKILFKAHGVLLVNSVSKEHLNDDRKGGMGVEKAETMHGWP